MNKINYLNYASIYFAIKVYKSLYRDVLISSYLFFTSINILTMTKKSTIKLISNFILIFASNLDS